MSEYADSSVSRLLPDRNHTDIPQQVQFFLSVCEVATISHRYQSVHLEEPQTNFCKGVVDYWWESNDDLVEPTLEQLWRDPFDKRIAYQKGAMVGYLLREEFKNDTEEAA